MAFQGADQQDFAARGRGPAPKRFFNKRQSRSGSRGRGQQRWQSQQQQYEHQTPVDFQSSSRTPQKDEAKAEIAKYEAKKQNPQHKDISLAQFFTEWIELVRANVVGYLDDFEEKIMTKYLHALSGQDDILQLQPADKREISDAMKSGFYLATSLRLLTTSSATQKGKDFAMYRLTEEISEMEVPTFYNAILSNLGKCTDENYGNFRILSPIMEAKRRILRGMAAAFQSVGHDYTFKDRNADPNVIMNTIGRGFNYYVFSDTDSVGFLRQLGRELFQEGLQFTFQTRVGNDGAIVSLSFPYLNFEEGITITTAKRYLTSIAGLSDAIAVGNAPGVTAKRDILIAAILFQLAKDDFLDDTTNTVGQVLPDFNEEDYDFIRTVTVRQLLDYVGVRDLTTAFDTPHFIANARVLYDFYQERAIPYLKRNMKVNMLTNSEFGSSAQFIERDRTRTLMGSRVDFSAISKFKDKNLNAFGAVFGFMKKLTYRRAITSTLNASEDAVLSQFVKQDMKYVK